MVTLLLIYASNNFLRTFGLYSHNSRPDSNEVLHRLRKLRESWSKQLWRLPLPITSPRNYMVLHETVDIQYAILSAIIPSLLNIHYYTLLHIIIQP